MPCFGSAQLPAQRGQSRPTSTPNIVGCSFRPAPRRVHVCHAWFNVGSQNKLKEQQIYGKAETKKIGPHTVSPMGIGTWAWGNQLLWDYDEGMDEELQQGFNLAVSKGINLFDTADSYGTGRLNGRSESLLGEFIRGYPGSPRLRQQVVVATKFAAYPWRILPATVVAAAKGSLQRTGLEAIGVGQLHWSTANYAYLQELAMWNGVADCYEQGLIQAVGLSNYGPKQILKAHKFLEKRGVPLDVVQVQFSLLSYGKLQQEVQQVCKDLGITLIAYSPLALGILTGKYSEGEPLPSGPRGFLFRQLLPTTQPLLQELQAVAASRRKTMAQVAVNWCVCKGTIPIPGAKSLAQVEGHLGALGWKLSSGEVAALEQAAARCKGAMVQNIFQTA